MFVVLILDSSLGLNSNGQMIKKNVEAKEEEEKRREEEKNVSGGEKNEHINALAYVLPHTR